MHLDESGIVKIGTEIAFGHDPCYKAFQKRGKTNS